MQKQQEKSFKLPESLLQQAIDIISVSTPVNNAYSNADVFKTLNLLINAQEIVEAPKESKESKEKPKK